MQQFTNSIESNSCIFTGSIERKMTSIWNHEDNLWVQDVVISNILLDACGILKTENKTHPVPYRTSYEATEIKHVFHQLVWGLAQVPGNQGWLVFFIPCGCLRFVVHFCPPFLPVCSALSSANNRLACMLLHNKTHISSSQQRWLFSNCWLRKTNGYYLSP